MQTRCAPAERRLLPLEVRGLLCVAAALAALALVPLAVLVSGRAGATRLDLAADAVRLPADVLDDLAELVLLVPAEVVPALMPWTVAGLTWAVWRRGQRRAAAFCLLAPAAAYLATSLLKPLVGRPSAAGEGWMFPSGHVTVVAAVGVVLLVLLLPGGVLAALTPRQRAWGAAAGVALPTTTAVATVVERHHHLTDVVGGALVAFLAVLVVAAALEALPPRRDRPAA